MYFVESKVDLESVKSEKIDWYLDLGLDHSYFKVHEKFYCKLTPFPAFIYYYSRPLFLWRSNTVIFLSLSVLRWRTRRQDGSNGKFLPHSHLYHDHDDVSSFFFFKI